MAESHWKLGRRGQRALSESEGNAANATHEALTVGENLRRHREERGLDLRHVAEMLHIRYPYLQAIENSLIDQLPGPAYALGFVKAYAEYIGLDSESVVDRFKAEQRGLQAKTELVFLSPLPEGKVPSAGILILAVVMAVAAYSGWMYVSDTDERVAEIVPPLPKQVHDIVKKAELGEMPSVEDGNDGPGEIKTNSEAASENVKQASAEKVDPGVVENAEPVVNESAVAEEVKKAVINKPTQTTPAMVAKVEGAAQNSAESAPEKAKPVAKTPVGANPVGANPVGANPVAANTAQKDETQTPAVFMPREPKVYGAEGGASRIIMRATGAAWVEIRDASKDEILLTRVLYVGDEYHPPSRPGLVLMTGNAGGIEISVDGRKAPSIGPQGSVRRNISLNPSALLEGRAVQNAIGLHQQQSEAAPKTLITSTPSTQ
jgi:cytoskeleton protein RodZ